MVASNTATEFNNVPSNDQQDDPLLSALLTICKILQTPHPAAALTAGLPLKDHKLTPQLLFRAAERAGLAAGLVNRPLDKISNLVLPAILLLKNNQTCVLVKTEQQQFSIIIPESGAGEKQVPMEQLQADYTGYAIFLQKQHKFDARTADSVTPDAKHWFWDVIFKSWPIYLEVLIASFLINLFALATPLFIMNVYDRVVPNHALETLWVLAAGVGLVFVFDFIMKTLRAYFIDVAGKRADIILSATIFERILTMRLESRPSSVGAFANNLQEFEAFRDLLTAATLATLIDLPFLLLFIAIIWTLGGELALIPVFILPLAILAALLAQKPLKNTISHLFKYSAQKNATLIEALSSLESIKTNGAEGEIQRKWEQNIGHISQLGIKSRFYASLVVNLATFLQQIAGVLVVIFGVYKIVEGDLTTGGLIACTILTGRAIAPIAQVATILNRYHQAKASLATMNRMMQLPLEREPGKQFLHRPQLKGDIIFRNVSFSYPEQSVKALDNVSFQIQAGEKVGFIGRIGSGKSTIEKLIMGLYQPQQGTILLDATEMQQLDPSDLRRQIGYVPQDISLMFGSVKDNITLGAKFTNDTAILNAAEISGALQFISRHPHGFDLQVGERGGALSGGQRQSVAVAQALLLAPQIYIMDEPTNAMDNSTEELFKQKFAEHLEDRTLILITHRASLLTLVDRLIVMDGAKILADGPKDQVMTALKQGKIKVST